MSKMIRFTLQILLIVALASLVESDGENESILSSVLLPNSDKSRQTRSYYERYGYGRPYDRLGDRRCGRCDDDDRDRDRDDDRRSNKPTYGGRHDRNKSDEDDDKRYDTDRRSGNNETDHQSDDKGHDDKDRDRHSDRPRNKHRNRYDDRDRYQPDYYDRFLRDRDRYDEPYPRRPLYERNPYPHEDYGRYDGYYSYRRPYYDDRYDRGSYDDGYGGYGPGVGAGPHDSFRPWDETYRGQSGWDAGGRGYYFASGRPDSSAWSQRDYMRPQSSSGWQNVGYQSNPSYSSGYGSYRDPYRGSSGYGGSYGSGYGSGFGYQDVGYGQSSGWQNVGASRRPYRDESGVTKLDSQYNQVSDSRYGNRIPNQPTSYQPASSSSQSTTPETGYLHEREDQLVKVEDSTLKDAQ